LKQKTDNLDLLKARLDGSADRKVETNEKCEEFGEFGERRVFVILYNDI
jgi:hypothetical protein